MRFVEGGVSEVIVTTDGPDGPNAAPMGVVERDGGLVMKVFEGATRRNLLETGEGVLNVTRDPVVFAETAVGIEVPTTEGEPPRLEEAEFHVPFEVGEAKDSSVEDELGESGLSVFRLETREVEEGSEEVRPLCRGTCAALEAAVHATRIRVAEERGREEEVNRLREELDRASDLVERTGGVREREALSIVMESV